MMLGVWSVVSLLVAGVLTSGNGSPVQGLTANPQLDDQWDQFKIKYNKEYEEDEEVLRRTVWEENYIFMENHNAAYAAGLESYSVGENQFNDLRNDEFVSMMNGLLVTEESSNTHSRNIFKPYLKDLPEKVDWRRLGFVTAVKDQKTCGSCWAFSATGSLEAATFNKTKKLVSLSEQNLVDCSAKEGNMGCRGGLMDNAFKYVKDNKGIDTEESYPYTAATGKECKFNASNVGANLTSWTDIKEGSEDDLQAAVAAVGPVSVAIDAGHPGFQMYKSGVYYSILCSSKRLDHGVLAVGYDQQEVRPGMVQKFWIVKNSWGTSWGEQGYIKMARGLNNMCGIATKASFPVV